MISCAEEQSSFGYCRGCHTDVSHGIGREDFEFWFCLNDVDVPIFARNNQSYVKAVQSVQGKP